MKISLLNLIKLTQKARHQSIKMQNRLLLYWLAMLLVVFMAVLVIMNITGVFSDTEEKVAQVINLQQKNTYTRISKQFESVAIRGLYLSEKISENLSEELLGEPFSVLNGSSEKIEETEKLIYGDVKIALHSSSGSGVFAVFDGVSENTDPDSAAGVFLRFENPDNGVYHNLVLYRGTEAVANENKIELHESWRKEFGSEELSGPDYSDGYYLKGKTVLPGTDEESFFFVVPVISETGIVYGACGIEISERYFANCYSSFQSDFGEMITVFAPIENGELLVSEGMLGSIENAGTVVPENLAIKKGKFFNAYIGKNTAFLGTHQETGITLEDGAKLYAVTLVPQEIYLKETIANRTSGLFITASLFVVVLLFSIFLSKKFVKPIVQSFEAISENNIDEAKDSGISEIDNLISMIREKEIKNEKNGLPYDIEEMFDEFSKKAESLTPTERSIIKYYADGKEINEIPELCFISINTVRKHNANIYRKLEVGSKEELMLYVELFRRCGRLEELL